MNPGFVAIRIFRVPCFKGSEGLAIGDEGAGFALFDPHCFALLHTHPGRAREGHAMMYVIMN